MVVVDVGCGICGVALCVSSVVSLVALVVVVVGGFWVVVVGCFVARCSLSLSWYSCHIL